MPSTRITPAVQTYAWGRTGSASLVHGLMNLSDPELHPFPSEDTPGAELWYGDHPSGPARQRGWENGSGAGAGDLLPAEHPLPYLLKVLSVGKALSIQAHPDKALAEHLHATRPEVYKDANHKPELAVAVGGPFEAMCMFRPLGQIAAHLEVVPELAEVVRAGEARIIRGEVPGVALSSSSSSSASSASSSSDNKRSRTEVEGADVVERLREALAGGSGPGGKAALRDVYASLMCADDAAVARGVSGLVARLSAQQPSVTDAESLALRLDAQFPGGDVGVFSAFLLNHVTLEEGQAVFLAANEPHAYLSGNCVEIMARSDNVVRGGCTPKLRDVPTLVSMLTYNTLAGGPAEALFQPRSRDLPGGAGRVLTYAPPVPEFKLDAVSLAATPGAAYDVVAAAEGAAPVIALVLKGNGTANDGTAAHPVTPGVAVYVAPGDRCTFAPAGSDGDLLLFVASQGH